MTKDDIIRMYEKANGWSPEGWDKTVNELKRFANLVAAAEREACAKLCDAECNQTPNEGNITTYQSGYYITAEFLAAAIRARGQND